MNDPIKTDKNDAIPIMILSGSKFILTLTSKINN